MANITTIGLQELGVSLERLNKNTKKKAMEELAKSANTMRNTIIRAMQQTTKASWFYVRGRKKHFPSLPGHAPAIDSGQLLKSIDFEKRTQEVEVGSLRGGGTNYAEYLEEGTKKMEARPFLDPSLQKVLPSITTNIMQAILGDI